jgi:hypothetical protein
MGPRNDYKDMLDKLVSFITCVRMNHQNQLEQMANGAMFPTRKRLHLLLLPMCMRIIHTFVFTRYPQNINPLIA